MIQPSSNVFEYHWVEESGNDLLTQAIFARQQKVQEHLLLTPEDATQSVASFLSSREVTVEKILRKLLNDIKNRE